MEGVCLNPLGGNDCELDSIDPYGVKEMGERRDGEGKGNGQGRRDKKRKGNPKKSGPVIQVAYYTRVNFY